MTSSFAFNTQELLLDIRNLSVTYGDVPVLKDMNVQVHNITRPDMQQAQIIGLLGPSGIGKTTFFKAMAGLLTPTAGEVRVGLKQEPTSPGMIGVVAQHYPLINHRTVLGNLLRAAKQAGMDAKTAREVADAYLVEFRLVDHATKYPIQLSGGQRQRVAIAQQLLCSEHFLVLDEPFSGLDFVNLNNVQRMLLSVAAKHENNTFILVTHDIAAAVSICDTIWLMGRDHGADGEPIPGARIKETVSLIDLDVCWHENVLDRPQARHVIKHIEERFATL